jgi:hypothetical protein
MNACRPQGQLRRRALKGTLRGITKEEREGWNEIKSQHIRLSIVDKKKKEVVFVIEVPADANVAQIKRLVDAQQSVYGTPVVDMVLRFQGQVLKDNQTVSCIKPYMCTHIQTYGIVSSI